MSTILAIVVSVVVAGALAWMVQRREASREPARTACADVIDEVFGAGASSTPDSALLARMLVHRDRCIDDPVYVDQTRRLMMNVGRIDDARTLIDLAEPRRALSRDEVAAQRAWIDLGAAHVAWTNDSLAQAQQLLAGAVSTANALRVKWPEWSTPYLLLREASMAAWTPESERDESYVALETTARRRLSTGAIARSPSEGQAVALAFAIALVGALGLFAAASGAVALRAMRRLQTSTIATAEPGYVELKGTLHVPPHADPVLGPNTHRPGVWYELETRTGTQKTQTRHERSAQRFLLRDATGEVRVDPTSMVVHTRHVATKLATGGVSSSRRATERMLLDGDVVYALGTLDVMPAPDGSLERRLHAPSDGRRFLVSTFSEERLALIERIWLGVGTAAFVLATIVLAWGWRARFGDAVVRP